MKFSVIIPLVAVGALAATPVQRSPSLVERDLATITSVINTISTKVDALDAAAKAFSGDKTALQSASDAVLSAINDGNSQIAASDSISLTDALSLTTIITNFEGKINTTVDDVIAKKDALVSAGLGDLVHQSFVDQKSAASTLAATITSKVPSDVQSVATQLSAGIAAALQRGVDAFANTGSSSSSSASAPGSTASAPGSSASASGSSASASGSPTPTESGSTPTSGSGSSASGSPSASGSASTYSAASSSAAVFTGAAVPIGSAGFGPAAAAVIAMVAAL